MDRTLDNMMVIMRQQSNEIEHLKKINEALLEAAKVARQTLFKYFQKEQREAFVKAQALDLWPELKQLNEAIAQAEDRP